MTKFSILKKPHDKMQPPKTVEVQLCLSEYVCASDGTPALTHMCVTEAEIEAQFERVISDIKKMKSVATAIIRKSA